MMSLIERARQNKLPSPADAQAIRQAAGVTQKQVAEELNVHRLTVQRWETGERSPRGDNKQRYARLLRELKGVI